MTFSLWVIGAAIAIFLAIYYKQPSKTSSTSTQEIDAAIIKNNQQWVSYLLAYQQRAESESTRAYLAKILYDLHTQGISMTPEELRQIGLAEFESQSDVPSYVEADAVEQPVVVQSPQVQLDNASLLLYFGAFLFVAAAGLFVTFGGANGFVRASVITMITILLYALGIWLYKTKSALKQAGQAFSAIGIVLAPLAGLAWYAYVLQGNGAVVWSVTSLLCVGMYVHALSVFRSTLISYTLLFTMVSLFESAVGVLQLPVYYYGWMFIVVALLLRALNLRKHVWPEVRTSSAVSAQLLITAALGISLILVTREGMTQLGVSLLLASLFYSLEFKQGKAAQRSVFAAVAQVTCNAGLTVLVVGLRESVVFGGVILAAMGLLQATAVWRYRNAANELHANFATISIASGIVAIALSITDSRLLLLSVALLCISAATIWTLQKRADAYVVAFLAWASLPYIFGQLASTAQMPLALQVILSAGFLSIAWSTLFLKQTAVVYWAELSRGAYLLTAIALLITAALAGATLCAVAAAGVVISLVILSECKRQTFWIEVAPVFITIALLRSIMVGPVFFAVAVAGLAYGITTALRYRCESLRWFSTIAWLVLPAAICNWSTIEFGSAANAWMYVIVSVCLLLSRAIAGGSLLVFSKVPIVSYARSASLSYVVGYSAAAALAVGVSLVDANSQLHTSIILGVYSALLLIVARSVEKQLSLVALLPIMLQAILLSIVRPVTGDSSLDVYVVASSAFAAISYSILSQYADRTKKYLQDVMTVIVATSFIAPGTVLFMTSLSVAMPIGLLVAGLLTLHFVWSKSQDTRDVAVGICIAAVVWFVYALGIREVQIYSHIIAAGLGLLAYWRTVRGMTAQADSYLWFMLTTVTAPLILWALGNNVYGLWLLLEMVAVMLMGMVIQKSFVTRWGLYVALGVVLYQLRNLGYAALALLAVFLIILAIVQLQRHGTKS